MFKKLFLLVCFGLAFLLVSASQSLKTLESETTELWSQLSKQLIRRTELVSDLSITMRKFIPDKSQVFDQIDNRIKSMNSINSETIPTKVELTQILADQNYLTEARTNLLDMAWSYDTLRADGGFRNIQDQGDRTENRLIVQKGNFMHTANKLNESVSRFPTNLVAALLGLETVPSFETPYWSGPAPKSFVDFSK